MIAEPLEEGDPAVCVLQREGVGQGRPDRTGIGPAQQPSPAVREDTHPHPALRPRLLQVVVELLDVLGVGVEASRGPDSALELYERVEGSEVHCAARAMRGRVLLNDLIAPYQPCGDEEIAHCAGDIRLGLAIVVPP